MNGGVILLFLQLFHCLTTCFVDCGQGGSLEVPITRVSSFNS